MARLIDADELLKDNTWEWFDEWGNYTSAGQAIADAPTVDAVEVVRCENCEFWIGEMYKDPTLGYCEICDRVTDNDDFCSTGIKMDGGDEE